MGLDFRIKVFSTHANRSCNRSRGCASTVKIPENGVLEPMRVCYLPIQSGFGAMIYVKAVTENSDYLRAEKDVIRLKPWGVDLDEQEGMYTCTSNRCG